MTQHPNPFVSWSVAITLFLALCSGLLLPGCDGQHGGANDNDAASLSISEPGPTSGALPRAVNTGTDFWLAYQHAPFGGGSASIFILSDAPTTFTVTGPDALVVTGTAAPTVPGIITLPAAAEISTNERIEKKAIHVVSNHPVTVLFHYGDSASVDTYLALPTAMLGTLYQTLAWEQTAVPGNTATSEVVLIAAHDNTQVTLLPACTSIAGTPPDLAVDLVLNRGETYQYRCAHGGDATGSLITSDHPLGVLAGHGCANVPSEAISLCDLLAEMLFPVDLLYGTEFFATPLPGNGGSVLRMLAAEDDTTVTIDDGSALEHVTLQHGQFDERLDDSALRISSDKPITVMQYALGFAMAQLGDPFAMQLVPTAAFPTAVRFFSPDGFDDTHVDNDGAFAIIVAPPDARNTVRLNDRAVTGFTPLPGGTHHYVIVPVPLGESVVTAPRPIGVYSVGFGGNLRRNSYGYPAGFAAPQLP